MCTSDTIEDKAVNTFSFRPDKLRKAYSVVGQNQLNKLLNNLAEVNSERLKRANGEINQPVHWVLATPPMVLDGLC
jgi:hypothetical protein